MTGCRIALSLAAACHSAAEKPRDTPQGAAAPVGSATPPTPIPEPALNGRDLPAPLYAGMFVDGATFEYTLYAYKVDKSGERHATKNTGKQRVKCFIHDLVFMHESKSLSARLTCDEPSPLNGVMFTARDGFWWYDEQRYLAGGFVMDESTKVFDREPKEIDSTEGRLYSVKREKDGTWCWSESFDRPWMSQGMCFGDGHLVSGWAANEATAKTNGDYIEFKLAK